MPSSSSAATEAAPAASAKADAGAPPPPVVVTGVLPAKDEDAVKLFVGQIPKDMEEEALRPVFAEYGTIFDLTVIRDKATGQHRGCAFLTYTSKVAAEKALEALHNKRKLPKAQNPLQVRPSVSTAYTVETRPFTSFCLCVSGRGMDGWMGWWI